MRRLAPLVLLVLLVPGPAASAVLCAKPKAGGAFNSTVKIREACKEHETPLSPGMVGWECACLSPTTTVTTTTPTTTETTTTSTSLPDVSGRWYFSGTVTATECPDIHPIGSELNCGPPSNPSCYFDVTQDGTTLDVHLSDTVPNFSGMIDVAAGTWTWGPCTYGQMTVDGFTSSSPAIWEWYACYEPECSYTATGSVTRP
jgi:hypothetical protein